MKTIKGPGIFLAQFAGDEAPYNSLSEIAGWAASLGFKGVQIPTWDQRLFDLKLAAESQTYCDEVLGTLASHGLASVSYTHLDVYKRQVQEHVTALSKYTDEAIHNVFAYIQTLK